ncbi:MAG: terminase [Dehalococcoidia bacterium]|nr:MAG: terminase [Dehalococcoidia bacterium]
MAFKATADDVKLGEYMMQFFYDPLGHVMASYPWGQSGTPLENEEGPDTWQSKFLVDLGRHIEEVADGKRSNVKMAVASGWGIGKTCLVAWLIRWFCDTRPYPQLVVTANTEKQLSTKTWRELAKWNNMALNGHLWDWTATSYRLKGNEDTWYASAIPWSEHNAQAFAGTHEKYVMMIFDEGSTIHDNIWNIGNGVMTTKGAVWLAFGNPTQNTGQFHAIFHKERDIWDTRSIDSRTAKVTNKEELNRRVALYGEDDDVIRVSILGKFPKRSSMQFISSALVEGALEREHKLDSYRHAAKVIAVDVARFGDDSTVFCCRKGVKLLWMKGFHGIDTMQTAQLLAKYEDEERDVDAIFVDVVGIGAGVVDRGRQLGRRWMEHNGAHASSDGKWSNKRAQCWGEMRDWLEVGDMTTLSQKDKDVMTDDLTGPMYGFDRVERLILEKKEDMKKRDLASPDWGDALAMTFTQKVIPQHMLEDEYDYAEAERQRMRADRTRSMITGY